MSRDSTKIKDHVPKSASDSKDTKKIRSGPLDTSYRGSKDKPHPYVKPRTGGQAWKIKNLCEVYKWPRDLDCEGVIGIVELGGGWLQSDINQYFEGENLPAPQICDISLDGTKNSPSETITTADIEVAADIQIAGAAYAFATGKAANIRIYWSQDITAAIRRATADGCDVCCVTWGGDEAIWGMSAAFELEQAAIEATAAGMIIFAAAGDNDSSDGGPTPSNVDLPASAPHVIGCGGTKRPLDLAEDETVWNDTPGRTTGHGTGGGYSRFFRPMLPWQAGAPHGPGRMVPDVAANSDPNTGYEITVKGAREVAGGTSAGTALYCGLFAAFGSKLGFVTPELYLHSTCFKDITSGDNGSQYARVGPDPCTGLGSPIGSALSALFADPVATVKRQLREAQDEIQRLRAVVASANGTSALTTPGFAPRVLDSGQSIHPGDVYRRWQDQYGNWWVQLYDDHLQPGPIQPAAQPAASLGPRIALAASSIQPGDIYRRWQDQYGVWWVQRYDSHLMPGPIQSA